MGVFSSASADIKAKRQEWLRGIWSFKFPLEVDHVQDWAHLLLSLSKLVTAYNCPEAGYVLRNICWEPVRGILRWEIVPVPALDSKYTNRKAWLGECMNL